MPAGDGGLCAGVWDPSLNVGAKPLMALLDGAASLFPAVPLPYLQLLATMANGQTAAGHAFRHIRVS